MSRVTRTESVELCRLARSIKRAHFEASRAAGRALQRAIAAGHDLNRAKGLLKHGEWLPFLKQQVGIRERTAQLYMRLANNSAEVMVKSATVADFGVREAARMLARSSHYMKSGSLHVQSLFTPKSTLALVQKVLGRIDTDPCWHPDCLVRAASTYTQAQDGLARPWHGRVYLNPPYHDLDRWTAKLLDEYATGRVTEAIFLATPRTDTVWWNRLRDWPRCFVRGRLHFANGTEGAAFPSVLFYVGPRADRFARVFAETGDVFVRYRPHNVTREIERPLNRVTVRRSTEDVLYAATSA
jgi:hypothetical protein